jgi:hypothetical protein
MTLLEQLKEMRADARDRMSECLTSASSYEELASIAREHIADLDRAIAALTPAPEAPAQTEAEIPEGWTKWDDDWGMELRGIPIALLFEDGSTFDTAFGHGSGGKSLSTPIIAYRAIEASAQEDASLTLVAPDPDVRTVPGAGEEIPDHFETIDSEPDAGFDAPDGETHFDATAEADARDPLLRAFEGDHIVAPAPPIDAQTCEPVDPRVSWDAEPGPHPEDASVFADDPAPDGYAPVTSPEADAIAGAHDYCSPEAQASREREESFLNRFNPFRTKVDA